MLRELRIRNIAIIDDLSLTFGVGLNVITGETGAGKSIILQSLALLCGARATADLIRSEADEALVEGLFACSPPDDIRDALGLDDGDEILIRRQVARNGKARIHINGSPATLTLLSQLGAHLVHLYGQHEQSLLLRSGSHRELLDRFGELGESVDRVAAAHAELSAAQRHRDELARRAAALEERRDLLEFQRQELSAAAPCAGEEASLRSERELLRHAGKLQDACGSGEASLYSGHGAMVAVLARLHAQIAELAGIAAPLAPIAELIESGRLQLEEAALQLRAVVARLNADPARLDAVEDRLAQLQRLSRKHGGEADRLPEVLAGIERDLDALAMQTANAAAADEAVVAQRSSALKSARKLSASRHSAARRLERAMVDELAALGMRGAIFRVEIETSDDALGADGIDRVEFLLAANAGEPPKPLVRVASGGELSRIMLALKALTASVGETPVLIFDEVDAGIGGTIADAVARRLKTLSHNRQLLCITHLAQIAAYADQHIAVEKEQSGARTLTRARALDAAARVAEVARMVGGTTAPAEAERYAKRLIAEAHRTS